MNSRLVPKDPKTRKKTTKKIYLTKKKISDRLFDQNSPVHQEAEFPRWHTQTHTQTSHRHWNLEAESAQCSGPFQRKLQSNVTTSKRSHDLSTEIIGSNIKSTTPPFDNC